VNAPRKTSHSAPFVVCAALALFGAVGLITFLNRPHSEVHLWVLVQLVLCGGGWWHEGRRGRLEPFNPIVIASAVGVLMYGLQALLVNRGTDLFLSVVRPGYQANPGVVLVVVRLQALGLAAMWGAWLLAARRAPKRDEHLALRFSSPGRVRLRGWAVFGVGIASTGVLILSSGGLSSLLIRLSDRVDLFAGKNYLVVATLWLPVVAAARLLSQGRREFRGATTAVVLTGIAASILTGSKANIGIALILLGIPFALSRGIRIRILSAAGLSLLLIVALSGYNLYFRDSRPRGVAFSQAIEDRGGVIDAFFGGFLANTFFGHQTMLLAVESVPTNRPYFGLYNIRALAEAPLPRSIRPDKKEALPGPFTSLVAPGLRKQGTTLPPTLFGEGYLTAGALGVTSAGAALGLASGALYSRRLRSGRLYLSSVVLSASMLHVMRGELYSVTILIVAVMAAVWLVVPPRTRLVDRLCDSPGSMPTGRSAAEAVLGGAARHVSAS
jgi:hypothetical protein